MRRVALALRASAAGRRRFTHPGYYQHFRLSGKKTPFYMISVIIIDRCNQLNHVLLNKYVFLHVSDRRKKMGHLHNTYVHYVVFNNLSNKSLYLTFIHSIKEGCTTKKMLITVKRLNQFTLLFSVACNNKTMDFVILNCCRHDDLGTEKL